MDLSYFEFHDHMIAELLSDEVIIKTARDALDIMANAQYQGAVCMIWYQRTIAPAFFDLSSGLAGDILQKFANYQMKLVIVGDFETVSSKSLNAFITESNRGRQVAFVANKDAALAKVVEMV